MNFIIPGHFKYPETERYFFLNHVEAWDEVFDGFGDVPRITLEIGALYGLSTLYILEKFCKKEGSQHYIMDINTNEYLENNILPYGNKVKFLLGESSDGFKKSEFNNNNKEFLDFVHIDGNHMSKFVLEDAVNSFYYLKNGGYMVFDDYGGGLEQEQHLQVKTGVDAFYHAYKKNLEVVREGYQVIFKKIEYNNKQDFEANYY